MKHVQTDVDYMCLPASVKTVIGGDRSLDEIAELLDFKPGRGTDRWHLTRLEQWGHTVRLGFGSLPRLKDCLERGIFPILTVALLGLNGEPHSVVLAALDGDVATVHDPVQPAATELPLATLLECW